MPTSPDPRTTTIWTTDALRALMAEGETPLLVVRHGQTAWNVERRFLGRSDISLDTTGEAQAKAVGQALSGVDFALVMASPLTRARRTAEAIRARPVEDDRWRELDQGQLEGTYGADLAQGFPEFFASWVADCATARPPGGETLTECQLRVMDAIKDLQTRLRPPPSPLVVVTHKLAIGCLVCAVDSRPLKEAPSVPNANGAINIFALSPRSIRTVAIDLSAHLHAP